MRPGPVILKCVAVVFVARALGVCVFGAGLAEMRERNARECGERFGLINDCIDVNFGKYYPCSLARPAGHVDRTSRDGE